MSGTGPPTAARTGRLDRRNLLRLGAGLGAGVALAAAGCSQTTPQPVFFRLGRIFFDESDEELLGFGSPVGAFFQCLNQQPFPCHLQFRGSRWNGEHVPQQLRDTVRQFPVLRQIAEKVKAFHPFGGRGGRPAALLSEPRLLAIEEVGDIIQRRVHVEPRLQPLLVTRCGVSEHAGLLMQGKRSRGITNLG